MGKLIVMEAPVKSPDDPFRIFLPSTRNSPRSIGKRIIDESERKGTLWITRTNHFPFSFS